MAYFFIDAALAWFAAAMHLTFVGGPMIGASGAINGIVGVFLLWYPLNSSSCIYWFYIRGGTFQISSYWMILFWLMFDIWGVASGGGSVAYWAHIGGFLAGMVILFPQIEIAFNVYAFGGSWDDFNFEMVLIAIGLIVGGVVARDNSVTSKNAGAE